MGTLTAAGYDKGEIVVRAASATGIEERQEEEIRMYVRDGLHVENLPSEAELTLYTIDGKCLKEQKVKGEREVVWPLDAYPSGVYLLQVKGKTVEWRARFVNR